MEEKKIYKRKVEDIKWISNCSVLGSRRTNSATTIMAKSSVIWWVNKFKILIIKVLNFLAF